jgi:hypothetical protein
MPTGGLFNRVPRRWQSMWHRPNFQNFQEIPQESLAAELLSECQDGLLGCQQNALEEKQH